MNINLDRLEELAKQLVNAWERMIETLMEIWSSLKRFAMNRFGDFPKNSDTFEVKPYPAARFTKGKQLRNFMLSNKPRRLCARTNC